MCGVTLRRLVVLLSLALIVPGYSFGATFEVVTTTDTDCSDGICDFQSALTASASNGEDDVINLPDTSVSPMPAGVTFEYTSSENSDLVINGNEAGGGTVLHGNNAATILRIRTTGAAATTISNLTIRNGASEGNNGGGLAVSVRNGDLIVEGCTFIASDAGAGNGGGAWLAVDEFGSGTATVRNNTFSHNSARNGAGLWIGFPIATIENNQFSNNVLTDTGSGSGAYITGNFGVITASQNTFSANSNATGVESCQGGGLYLSASGFDTVTIERNTFTENQLGHNGSGAGAYLSRIDGPLRIEANVFRENAIDGTAEDTGGGGLWVNAYGSFAECEIVNNAFVDNVARLQGTAAWIYSLDGGILFANNTAIHNHPRIPTFSESGSNAVLIDSPQADLYNNIITNNTTRGNDLMVRDGFVTETITLRNNNIGRYSLPSEVNLDAGGNISSDPGFSIIPYHSIYLASSAAPPVDAGTSYAGMPETDIQGEVRQTDGDGNGFAVADIGADELGAIPILVPDAWTFTATESTFAGPGYVSEDYKVFYLVNIGSDPIIITRVALETDLPAWSLGFRFDEGDSVGPEESVAITVAFWPESRRDSNNRLIVETSAGTVTADLVGNFEPAAHSDGDGVSDEIEGDHDGNCDGIPDRVQDHVASLFDAGWNRFSIVAPVEKVGVLGDFYPESVIPILTNVSLWPARDEGGGPTTRYYAYSFFTFDVSTLERHDYAGGSFPISIILPADAPEIDGYTKRGPVPADFPPSLVDDTGYYDFIWNPGSDYPWFAFLGAFVEEDVPLCDGENHRVVHLRFIDGKLGDGDLEENGIVHDPGGPAIMPEGYWDDDDDEVVRIFPGTASAPGKDDAFFVTDVRLYNPDPVETITVNLSFLDRDEDNSDVTETPVEIPPRQAVAYNDVLASLFGISNAAGAIRMRSSKLFYATSRTYNEGGPDGTFGSFCPGLAPEDALDQGILLQVANDPADSGFRANVGFANPGLSPVDVNVSVYNADTGELIGSKIRELLPRTFSQINNVLKFVGKKNLVLSNAAVEFTSNAPVLAYTTVIDNTSDDPIFVLPFADIGTPPLQPGLLKTASNLSALTAADVVRIFPGTASAPGKDDAFFVTDVRLYNPDADDTITVHLSFLDRDANNSGATEIPVDIPPRQAVAYNDVLASLFGLSDAAGAIRMRSSSLFYATSRTYNEGGPDGTFGSFCPGLSPDDALTQGILLQVANDPADSGFRANVGFANPGLNSVDVTVRVYNADTGELIGSKDRELLPRTFSQINNVLKFVGKKNLVLTNVAVEFTATGPVLAYTTVIDNTSDDPIFVLPFADTGTVP
jgi:hypothetical protein